MADDDTKGEGPSGAAPEEPAKPEPAAAKPAAAKPDGDVSGRGGLRGPSGMAEAFSRAGAGPPLPPGARGGG